MRSCFRNQDRKMFPDFPQRIAGHKYELVENEKIDNIEFFVARLSEDLPVAVAKFSQQQIDLFNVSSCYRNLSNSNSYPPVDSIKYLKTLRQCRWHGPFKELTQDWYYFLTINQEGDNEYYVRLELQLIPCAINLAFYKGNLGIRNKIELRNS